MSNELQHIIDSKRELLRRETVLRSPINYSAAMPSDQKDRYIRYLIESQEEKDLELRAMRMAVEEFQSIHDRVSESLANLQKEMAEIKRELSSERSKRKAAESRARKLDQQLNLPRRTVLETSARTPVRSRKSRMRNATVTTRRTASTERQGHYLPARSLRRHPHHLPPQRRRSATHQTDPTIIIPCR